MALPPPVNIGSLPNDGQGDPLRVAFDKLNKRDDYLLSVAGGWSGAVAAEATAREQGDQYVLDQISIIMAAQFSSMIRDWFLSLPTDPSTLSSGDLYNNGGTIVQVP